MNGRTVLLVALLAAVACWSDAADPAKPAPPSPAAADAAADAGQEEGVEGRTLGKLLRHLHNKRPSRIGSLLRGHKHHRDGPQVPLGGAHYGHVEGGQQHGHQQAAQGFNQGSQAFEGQDKYKNVQGFRETKGYRTEMGFEETSFNRYGSGTGGFQGGFNQHSAGKFQQQGQQQAGFVAAPGYGGR